MSEINTKEIARELQEIIKKYDDKASYQSCLHAVSRYYGYKNYNTLSAMMKDSGIELNEAPRPIKHVTTNGD